MDRNVLYVHAGTCLRSEHPWECSNWALVLRCFPTGGWCLHRRTSEYIPLTSASVRVDPLLNNGNKCSVIFTQNDLPFLSFFFFLKSCITKSQIKSGKCSLITYAHGQRAYWRWLRWSWSLLVLCFLIAMESLNLKGKKKRGKCKENLLKTLVNFCKHERREY